MLAPRVHIETGSYRNAFKSNVINRKFFDIHPFRYFLVVLQMLNLLLCDMLYNVINLSVSLTFLDLIVQCFSVGKYFACTSGFIDVYEQLKVSTGYLI